VGGCLGCLGCPFLYRPVSSVRSEDGDEGALLDEDARVTICG
jgi:hypothetical protein